MVYKKCHLNKDIIYIDDIDLVVGDEIKIITEYDGNIICEIIEINAIMIKINKIIKGKYCLIYDKNKFD